MGAVLPFISLGATAFGAVSNVIGAVAVRKPEPARARSILYDTKDGGLSIDNPRQLGLPFTRDASPQSSDLRVV